MSRRRASSSSSPTTYVRDELRQHATAVVNIIILLYQINVLVIAEACVIFLGVAQKGKKNGGSVVEHVCV